MQSFKSQKKSERSNSGTKHKTENAEPADESKFRQRTNSLNSDCSSRSLVSSKSCDSKIQISQLSKFPIHLVGLLMLAVASIGFCLFTGPGTIRENESEDAVTIGGARGRLEDLNVRTEKVVERSGLQAKRPRDADAKVVTLGQLEDTIPSDKFSELMNDDGSVAKRISTTIESTCLLNNVNLEEAEGADISVKNLADGRVEYTVTIARENDSPLQFTEYISNSDTALVQQQAKKVGLFADFTKLSSILTGVLRWKKYAVSGLQLLSRINDHRREDMANGLEKASVPAGAMTAIIVTAACGFVTAVAAPVAVPAAMVGGAVLGFTGAYVYLQIKAEEVRGRTS